MPIKKDSLISEIKTLRSTIPSPPKVKEPEEKEEVFTLSSLSKKKKDKKKKKKNKEFSDLEFMSAGEIGNVSTNEDGSNDDDYDATSAANLIDIDEIFREDSEDGIDDGIIDEQKKSYDKLKKEENPYKKEFAEELTLLYNLLDEVNKFGKRLDKKYEGLEASKTRGVSKYVNDLIMSILSSKQNKLSIIKEISSIKKTIADLKIKADGKTNAANAQGGATSEMIATTYLKNVLKYGRNNFVKEFGSRNNDDDDDEVDSLVEQIEKSKDDGMSDIEMDRYSRLIEERLSSVENPFRSEEGSKYIEYENRGVRVVVKKWIDTGDWEFVALDKNNQQVFDYPLPRKKDIGRVKFSDDGRYATDERGRSYKVIEVVSPDEDDDD